MLRAKDKLEEAEFFLEKLKETSGKGKEFSYYLSACASAMRSITLVLQTDLRSEHGSRFDDWWNEKKQTVPNSPISFEEIVNIRNVFQKKGSFLPADFSLEINGQALGNTQIRLDPTTKEFSITYKVPRNKIPSISRREGESDDEFINRMIEEALKKAIPSMLDDFSDYEEGELVLLGYSIIDGSPPLPFDSIVTGFSKYLFSIRGIVEEAEREFKQARSGKSLSS